MNKQKSQKIMILMIFTIGLLIMTYPLTSNAFNTVYDTINMNNYYRKEKARFESEKEELLKRNEKLNQDGFNPGADPFDDANYSNKVLENEHFLGSISIPKLNLKVPLFDTTTNSLLDVGATVLDGTSMPVGGEGNHSVITAHRGLPNRELFTNIPKLVNGDIFVIDVFGEKLAYKMIDSQTVLPHETSSIQIQEGEDLVTLLTCTPYMINTHRLLVTGERTELTEEIVQELESSDLKAAIIKYMILGLLLLIILITLFVLRKIVKNNSDNKKLKK